MDGVLVELEIPELTKVAKLWRQRAVEAVAGKIKPPQVGEVSQCRAHLAEEAELWQCQRDDTAVAASPRATRHAAPLAHRRGSIAAPRR